MTILLNKEPFVDDIYDDSNYKLEAKIECSEECTVTEALYAFIKALEIEGYHKVSIIQALYDVAKVKAWENNVDIDNSIDDELN